MTIQKIKSGRVTSIDADQFVGPPGTLFFNEDQGDLRLGDGVTPGGIPLSFGGGGGGSYVLPTATTTIKGGVKIDGSTITIANQVISVGTITYNKISNPPTIPTNTNQLTNGAGYITSSALSGYATESYVTSRGYLTSVSWSDITSKPTFATVATTGSYNDLTNRPTLFSGSYTDLTNKPTIPTNTNELINGAGYITSSALSGYATESYVTGRGYITSSALTDYALTSSIPTDISDLTDTQGLLGQGGGTTQVSNPFTFNVAGDDSTLIEITNENTVQFKGSGGITVTANADGVVTIAAGTVSYNDLTDTPTIPSNVSELVNDTGFITNSSLTGYATESYVIAALSSAGVTVSPTVPEGLSNGALWYNSTDLELYVLYGGQWVSTAASFSGDYNDLTNKPTALSEFANDTNFITASALSGYALSADIPTNTNQLTNGAGFITGLSWAELTDKPNLAGTYTWSIAADDSTQIAINSDNTVKFIGGAGINTSADADGNITITGFSGSYTDLTNRPNLFSGSYNDLTDKPNLAGTYTWSIAADDSTQVEIGAGNLVKIVGAGGVTTTSNGDGQITVTGPDLSSYATRAELPSRVSDLQNDRDYVTRDEVYAMILELGSTN